MESDGGDGGLDEGSVGPEYALSEGLACRRGRRRVGRPTAYTGDPNAPHLTEADRRRLRRCDSVHQYSLQPSVSSHSPPS